MMVLNTRKVYSPTSVGVNKEGVNLKKYKISTQRWGGVIRPETKCFCYHRRVDYCLVKAHPEVFYYC